MFYRGFSLCNYSFWLEFNQQLDFFLYIFLHFAEKVGAHAHHSVQTRVAEAMRKNLGESQALATLDAMAAEGGQDGAALGPNELLEKGRLLDRIGSYEEAFAAFVEGKRLAREGTGLSYLEEPAATLAGRKCSQMPPSGSVGISKSPTLMWLRPVDAPNAVSPLELDDLRM